MTADNKDSDLDRLLSTEFKALQTSIIRDLLEKNKEDIIYLAGGMPHFDTFPYPGFGEIIGNFSEEDWQEALQYGKAPGKDELRDKLAAMESEDLGVDLSRENIAVLQGSQQGLDLLRRNYLNQGDVLACARPTYLAAR